jgi:DNA polymerase III subunit epsilon
MQYNTDRQSPTDIRPLSESLILAIDVETTGTSPLEDSIVELGGAYVKGGSLFGPPLCSKVNPKRYIPIDATRIHGISAEDVAQSPTWKTVSSWFKRHLDQAQPVLCGYNILSFDAPLINAENTRVGLEWQLSLDTILDPYIFCRWYHPEVQSTLSSMCKTYGLDLPENEAHSADADSEVTALLVVAMVWAGYIPDDVDEALKKQHQFKKQMEADKKRWGKGVYVNRQDPDQLHIARGIYRGRSIDELDDNYIKRLLNEWKDQDLSVEGKAYVTERRKTQETLF